MPDYSKMFGKSDAVVGHAQPTSLTDQVNAAYEYRKDLSIKINEHIEAVKGIVTKDFDPIAAADESLGKLLDIVEEFVATESSFFKRLMGGTRDLAHITSIIEQTTDGVKAMLEKGKRVDPFFKQSAVQVVNQADYLVDQINKVCDAVTKLREPIVDDILRDAYNKRLAALTMQLHIVADGKRQLEAISVKIQTRTNEAEAYIASTLQLTRKLCLDVAAGTVKVSELRKRT